MPDSTTTATKRRSARETLSAEQLDTILRGRPGLIVGPGLTLGAGCLREMARDLATAFDGPPDLALPLTADAIVAKGVDILDVRKRLHESIQRCTQNPAVDLVVKTRWSTVLSATPDLKFEQAFQQWCEKSPLRRAVSVVTNFRQAIPPNTIAVYKLLGSSVRDDFVVTSNDYRVQQPLWHRPLRDFASLVQGAPVLCLGMAECPWVLLDVLAQMLADPLMVPGPLLLLQDDPVARDGQLNDLARRGLRVVNIEMPLGGFISALEASSKTAHTLRLPFDAATQAPLEQLRAFSDLAVVVNTHTTSTIAATETHRLRDLLFSPSAPRWSPFAHNLDFPRTVSRRLLDRIQVALAPTGQAITEIIVRGASATGKTTILKRAAFDIAHTGTLVLWLRPYFFQNGPTELRKLFEKVVSSKAHNDHRIAVFVDDPLSLGAVRLDDIADALVAVGLEAAIIVGTRSTDVATSDAELSLGIESAVDEIEIPDRFDEGEWKALPEYLVRLGIAKTIEEARASTTNAPGRSTRDVLSMLFWLLPETRQRITESVRDEYLRLGDRAAFSQVIIGELNHTTELLKNAYGLVAAAGKYGAPVPMEVLVSALAVGYDEWLSATTKDGLLWGLLYQEASDDGETTIYRTRNDVVNDIIVTMVNGGTLSRAGELARLGRLLSACNGASPVYREFCLRILVPPPESRTRLEELEYSEGIDLFERAIGALPFEDRTLVHQMGRWEKNKGHNPARAKAVLERALHTQLYPYASKGEAIEHIHTTLAATELDAIKLGQVSPDQGKQAVLSHLERARAGHFFNNPNAVHVQAKLISGLADLTGHPSDPDSIGMIDTALGDVDRMLLLLKSTFVADAQRRHNIELLEEVRGEVLDRCVSAEQISEDAERLWNEYRRQDGFALIARRLYGKAAASNKGTEFKEAFDFCEGVRQRVSSEGEHLSHQMAEVILHVYFRWRVRRRVFSETTDKIDWKFIESLATLIVGLARSKRDSFYSYVLALAKAHLNDWSGANAIFNELRNRGLPQDVLFEPRDFLMGDKGAMLRVQGIVGHGAGKKFLHVETLKTDFLLDRYGKWANDGAITHAYVRFRFAGPIAVEEP